MNLIPFATLVQDAGLGALGVDLFLQMLPAQAQAGTLLRNTLSPPVVNYEIPGYFHGEFQLIVRGSGYVTGPALIEEIIKVITLQETQLDGYYIRYARPQTLPVSFPMSKGNLVETSVTFDICFMVDQ